MELNSMKVPRFNVQRSAVIGGTEHQMSVNLELQGWHEGPFNFDEAALIELFRACRTFMQAHTAGQTVDSENLSIGESWQEDVSDIEVNLDEPEPEV